MKRKVVIALLALGTIGGFSAGFRSMRCHAQWRRSAFEEHVARVCVDAAQKAQAQAAPAAPLPVAPKGE